MCGIRYVGLYEECAVGCIRSACVGVVVSFARLRATVDGESGCYEAISFLLNKDLAAHEDGIGFDGVSWEEHERFVCCKMLA